MAAAADLVGQAGKPDEPHAPLGEPEGQRRDGFPQPVIWGKHPVVAVPMFSRRRHKVRQAIKELQRRQLDHDVGARPRGLSPASRADDLFRVLMGEKVEPRHDFIERHALDVKNLDV